MSNMFVADVGGTNIRLALVLNGELQQITKYLCKQFDTITDAINQFAIDVNVDSFEHGCIAIACPVNNDVVKMTNHTWTFSKIELQNQLSLNSLLVINDFSAVAFSLPNLKMEQVIQIGTGEAVEKGNIVVFGPGTGLGVEHLTWTDSGWQTLDGEGGHVWTDHGCLGTGKQQNMPIPRVSFTFLTNNCRWKIRWTQREPSTKTWARTVRLWCLTLLAFAHSTSLRPYCLNASMT